MPYSGDLFMRSHLFSPRSCPFLPSPTAANQYIRRPPTISRRQAGVVAGMGQTPSLAGASAGVSPFASPPYVITVDELVAHWIGWDELQEQQHGRQRRQHPAQEEEDSSSTLVGGATGTHAEATTALTAHHHGEAVQPPSVALVTVRRRDGVEVLVSRQIAYGGRVRLPPLLEEEEVTVAFSDGSIVRLPASAVQAQAGMGEALYLLEQQEPHSSTLSRSRRRSSSQCHQLVYRVERPVGGGALVPYDDAAAAALLPLRLAGEREVQLAVVLVNMACHHHDLTGVTLLLLGLLLFAEAWKRHAVEGQQGRQALQAAAVGLELVAERCMARRRSSVVEMAAARGRALTVSTTTTTTTTTVTTTMTTMVVEEGEVLEGQGQGVASVVVTERRRSTRSVSSSSSSSVALLATEMRPYPHRYLLVCGQDPVRAAAMWAATLRWRADYCVDAILERPHTKFHLIKQCFPQFLAGRSKSGQPVYYEQTGRIDQAALRTAGVSVDDMLHAYVYLNEFLYTRLVTDEEAQVVTVVDVGGLSMGGMSPQSIEFATKALGLIQSHYPARAQVILLVNAPSWFSWVWGYVKSVADEHTSKTLRVVPAAKTHAALREYIDAEQIPLEYGGTLLYPENEEDGSESDCECDPLAAAKRQLPHSVRWTSPFEVAIRAHVERVLAGGGMKDGRGQEEGLGAAAVGAA